MLSDQKKKKQYKKIRYRKICLPVSKNDLMVFKIVKKLMHDGGQRIFKPLNIVYRTVRKIYQIVNYYFSASMRQAYCTLRDRGKRDMESTAA